MKYSKQALEMYFSKLLQLPSLTIVVIAKMQVPPLKYDFDKWWC
jgi:hypothetical protein